MKCTGITAVAVLALVALVSMLPGDEPPQPGPLFLDKPIWTSGTKTCGGDGNARWIDFDRDGYADLVTSAPNPSRWVVYKNEKGKLASKPCWESKGTTDCDHISDLDFNKDGWTDLAGTHESH